jgi:hypothetical protein
MIIEDKPEPGKSLIQHRLQDSLATIKAISAMGRYGIAGRSLAPGIT